MADLSRLRNWKETLAANSAATSFASKVPTTTKPTTGSTTGITECEGFGTAEFLFFGTDANNETFDVRIIGWSQAESYNDGASRLWVPEVVCQCSCIMSSTAPGAASAAVLNTEYFVDTITVNYGIGVPYNNAGDVISKLVIDVSAYELIEVSYDMTGAASANALIRLY